MTDDLTHATLATWAGKGSATRLDVPATAKLRGFNESDMQIFMTVGKLTPLGDPASNAPKWFAAQNCELSPQPEGIGCQAELPDAEFSAASRLLVRNQPVKQTIRLTLPPEIS